MAPNKSAAARKPIDASIETDEVTAAKETLRKARQDVDDATTQVDARKLASVTARSAQQVVEKVDRANSVTQRIADDTAQNRLETARLAKVAADKAYAAAVKADNPDAAPVFEPTWRYHQKTGASKIVKTEAELDKLGDDWGEAPHEDFPPQSHRHVEGAAYKA